MSSSFLIWAIVVVVVLAVAAIIAAYQAGRRRDEWERQIAESFATIAANHKAASRHALTMPRTGAAVPSPASAPAGQRRPATSLVAGQQTQRSRPPVPPPPRQRIVTTAGELGPVFYPRGDTRIPVRPQAAPHPGPDTLARGELTRITDAWIANFEREQAAWRASRGLAPAMTA